jgi:hypothetical protein
MLVRVSSKLLSNPITSFFLDPIIPKIISIYLSQKLSEWKSNGLLESYEVKVQRISRLCYNIRLHVLAKKRETKKVLADYISKLLGTYLADLF